MHTPTALWRTIPLVALILLAGPWAQAQDARTARQATALARLQETPVGGKVQTAFDAIDASRTAGPVDLLRTGGPDLSGYSFTDSTEPGGPTYVWIDISGTSAMPGTPIAGAQGDDGISTPIALPFTFNFYGTDYTTIRVAANGFASLGSAFTTGTQFNVTIPNSATPNHIIAPYWDDLIFNRATSPAPEVRYRDMGDGRFVISWINGQHYWPEVGNTSRVTFQAILVSNGDIRFQYRTVTLGNAIEHEDVGTPPAVTTGVEGDGTFGQGLLVNFDQAGYIAPNLAVNINKGTPPPPPNDDLANAFTVDSGTFTDVTPNGNATREPHEQSASCTFEGTDNDANNSIWWSYVPGANGSATVTTQGHYTTPSFDTIQAIYTGPTFPLTEVACADGQYAGDPETNTFAVTAGTQYYIRVTGFEGSSGTVTLTVNGPEPVEHMPTYTVTEPAAGSVFAAGTKVNVRWSGTGVPDRNDDVDIFLRYASGDTVLVAAGVPNSGKAKLTLPADVPTDDGYAFLVQRSDDASVYGVSGAVGIYFGGDQYTFAEPDPNETWLRGSTHTILWTAPAGAPAGTVTLALVRANGTVAATYAGEPDDGSFDFTTLSTFTTGSYSFTITNDADGLYFGSSPRFTVARIEVTAPAEGAALAAGSPTTITWTTAQAHTAGATVKLSLRSVDGSTSLSLANNVPYGQGMATVTIPASVPAGPYYVLLLYRYTSPGGVLTGYLIPSNPFTVTSPVAAPPVASRHFGSPVPGTDAEATTVVVRGLAEGAEVGVFAGEYVLATGLVEGGEAVVAVPSEIAVGRGEDALELYFGETTALTLRVFDGGATSGGAESAVEAQSVTLGSDGSPLSSVRLAAGDVVIVDAIKGGEVSAPATALTVAAYPNPASTVTTVRVSAPSSVVVYDVLGRRVADLGVVEAEMRWDTGGAAPGVYVVRASTATTSQTVRVTVAR